MQEQQPDRRAAVRIRKATPADAAAYLDMMLQLDCETAFMMYELGERIATPESVAAELRRIEDGGGVCLVVEECACNSGGPGSPGSPGGSEDAAGNGRLVGFLTAERGFARRIRHIAYVVVGLLAQVRGQGIGGQLFAMLEQWALAQGVTRLELTVMTHNYAAVRLYERMGFVVEGYREQALVVDGQPVNEFSMARLLKPPGGDTCG